MPETLPRFNAKVDIDVDKCLVVFNIQEGLELPKTTRIPFGVLKQLVGQIILLEGQGETGAK